MKVIVKSVLLFLLLSSTAHAQLRELDISPIQNNRVPVFRDHPKMAAVIVNSSLTNLRLDSNMEVIATLGNPNQGEYILIVMPVRQIITINAPGFQQARLSVALNEPKQVLQYRIEPKPEVVLNLIPTNIQVTPADAIVSIDGNRVDISKPVPIEVGTHMIRIEKQGFRTIEKEVRVSAEQNLIRETLAAIEVVPITIKTQPAGASILLDGVQVGVTDRNGDIGLFRFPGTYELSVQLSGHVSETRTITVNEIGPNATSITLIRNAGTLRLSVTPSDATVLLNRQPHNPSLPADLAPGMVLVEVSKPDHDPFSESVEIVRGQTESRSFRLTPHLGGFQITPTPLQASWILTDASGKVVMSGTGLARKGGIPVGNYSLMVKANEYQDYSEAIRIVRDQVLEKSIALKEGTPPCTGVSDVDGNCYAIVRIGNQQWMAENLRTTKYRDGTGIPNVTDNSQWGNLRTGAWAHYDNQTANDIRYGKLYNWYAVKDSRKICPRGWSVPSNGDWSLLYSYLASDVGFKMKATSFGGLNESGFNGLPGGLRGYAGAFYDFGGGNFWSSSDKDSNYASYWYLSHGDRDLFTHANFMSYGFSVRCIRD